MKERPELTPLEERARQVLHLLKELRHLDDADIAEGISLSRSAIQDRLGGGTRIHMKDVERLSDFFNIEPAVFLMTRTEALRWMLDNQPELLESASRWITANPSDLLECAVSAA